MADAKPGGAENAAAAATPDVKPDTKPSKPVRPPNPIYKYMGLGENFRPRLPSRNWTIFFTIAGSFTAAVIYDKREKKRNQRKWCKLVEHIGKEPVGSANAMPRVLTVFLEAPPTDGLRVAQDHFKDYVKPILVASGLDWEFIQGRKEGDVRAELAEKIRNSRLPPGQRAEDEDPKVKTRQGLGIKDFEGPKGDIVIGRHTWKEYMRGLHEGWLGPLTEPPKPEQEETPSEPLQEANPKGENLETLPGITVHSSPGQSDTPPETSTPAAAEEKPKNLKPPPFISTCEYKSAPEPEKIPTEFDPSQPISFPHILGFLNTPLRLYRFLNRRHLADQIGRDTAAVILAASRPYSTTSSPSDDSPDSSAQETGAEQQTVLIGEEKEWHKSARVRKEGEPERTWLEPVVLDPRIASRMRRAELTAEDEQRARGIVVPEEEIEGWIKGGIRSGWRGGKEWLGFGAKKDAKPIDGNEELLE